MLILRSLVNLKLTPRSKITCSTPTKVTICIKFRSDSLYLYWGRHKHIFRLHGSPMQELWSASSLKPSWSQEQVKEPGCSAHDWLQGDGDAVHSGMSERHDVDWSHLINLGRQYGLFVGIIYIVWCKTIWNKVVTIILHRALDLYCCFQIHCRCKVAWKTKPIVFCWHNTQCIKVHTLHKYRRTLN